MTRIDVLMPAAGTEYAAVAAEYLTPYRAPFAARGLTLAEQPWPDAPGDGAAATLALFAWGYHFDVARWEAILAAWPAERPLFNRPALLAWNTRKTYLNALAARGLPVVPSRFGRANAASVAADFAAFGCDELVVKPQVSGGSYLTSRLRPGDRFEPIEDAIVQPFLPAIGKEGELSFLFIGGTFSHAVRKVAAHDDFRIQPQFGGRFSAFTPDPADRALAERVVRRHTGAAAVCAGRSDPPGGRDARGDGVRGDRARPVSRPRRRCRGPARRRAARQARSIIFRDAHVRALAADRRDRR